MSTVTSEVCPECVGDLEHCHGTTIVHVDGSWVCTDAATCRLGVDAHGFVAECDDPSCCPVDPIGDDQRESPE